MRRALPFIAALVLAVSACGGDGSTAEPDPTPAAPSAPPATPSEPATPTAAPVEGDCSAAAIELDVVAQPELPAEVDATRRLLTDAALRCDEQLLRTAADESPRFTYAFEEQGDLIGYLWRMEEAGEPAFAYLAQLLQTTPALSEGGDAYVWPRVLTGRPEDTTEEAWAELVPIFGEARTEEVRTGGDGMYLSWRVGISPAGDWTFFVTGG